MLLARLGVIALFMDKLDYIRNGLVNFMIDGSRKWLFIGAFIALLYIVISAVLFKYYFNKQITAMYVLINFLVEHPIVVVLLAMSYWDGRKSSSIISESSLVRRDIIEIVTGYLFFIIGINLVLYVIDRYVFSSDFNTIACVNIFIVNYFVKAYDKGKCGEN